MKTLIVILAAALLHSCKPAKDIQVIPRNPAKDIQVISRDAVLVRIDTVWRYNGERLWLRWNADDVLYSEMRTPPIVEFIGCRRSLLLRK
jgi:hypothetical protein